MNIGLFGLSGVGKSYLTSSFCAIYNEFIGIKASEIIKSGNNKIDFFELKPSIINDNQDALITGFKNYQRRHPEHNIIIELHNLIEIPGGVSEIDDGVFDALDLGAVCFLEAPIERLLNQREIDSSRVRTVMPFDELERLQNRSRNKFLRKYGDGKIPYTVLQVGDVNELAEFIARI